MPGDEMPGWPYLADPEHAEESAPADDGDEYDGGQESARLHILEWFRSAPRRHLADRSREPMHEVPPPGSGRQRQYRDRRTGQFAQKPEQLQESPADDTVLSIEHAADAAGPRVGGPVRAIGRDATGEYLRTPRPAQRPGPDTPFEHEITFPGQDHGDECRCFFCYRPDRAWWLSRRRGRRR